MRGGGGEEEDKEEEEISHEDMRNKERDGDVKRRERRVKEEEWKGEKGDDEGVSKESCVRRGRREKETKLRRVW